VERIVKEMGYVRNRAARALGGGQSGLIDLIVSKPLDSEYFLEIIRGAEEMAQPAGKNLVLSTIQDESGLERIDQVADRSTDGVLLLLPRMYDHYARKLQEHTLPFVVIDTSVSLASDIPSVGTTNRAGGLLATQYLLSLGHQRIGIIVDTTHYLMAHERFLGYQAALHMSGISLDDNLVRVGNFHPEDGLTQTRALLALDHPPTAIFAGSDWQAAGVYRAIYERGLTIPGDISVIGFDDIPSARWMSPPLTTMRQPLKEMGQAAMTLLLRMIAEEELEETRVELPCSLIVRESCAPLCS
jgi:LacI family transcriptional regulator